MIALKIIGFVISIFLIYIIFLFVCSIFVNKKKEYEAHSRFYRMLLNGATTFALKIMRIRIHTEGIEKVPPETEKILFVCNHRSNFDPIVTWHVLKKWKPAFISKESNFRIPIFGRIIRKCCFMAIDRENPRNALKTVLKAADLLQKGEVSIGVYPEGTRSKNCELLPFHNGVFKIAQKANASLVVLTISGTEQIHRNYPFHHTDVCLSILKNIPANKVKELRTEVLGEEIRECMKRKLQQ